MSIKFTAFEAITCDRCGTELDDGEYTWFSLGRGREQAYECDWLYLGGVDICPNCTTSDDRLLVNQVDEEEAAWKAAQRVHLCPKGVHMRNDAGICRACYDRDERLKGLR